RSGWSGRSPAGDGDGKHPPRETNFAVELVTGHVLGKMRLTSFRKPKRSASSWSAWSASRPAPVPRCPRSTYSPLLPCALAEELAFDPFANRVAHPAIDRKLLFLVALRSARVRKTPVQTLAGAKEDRARLVGLVAHGDNHVERLVEIAVQ